MSTNGLKMHLEKFIESYLRALRALRGNLIHSQLQNVKIFHLIVVA